jgi:hypothetical protein
LWLKRYDSFWGLLTVRRLLSISVLLPAVTGLLTFALAAIFAFSGVHALERREDARRIPLIVDISYDLFAAIQDFRLERGSVNRALAASETASSDVQSEIVALRAQSAKSLNSALTKLARTMAGEIEPEIEKIDRTRIAYADEQRDVDEALRLPG